MKRGVFEIKVTSGTDFLVLAESSEQAPAVLRSFGVKSPVRSVHDKTEFWKEKFPEGTAKLLADGRVGMLVFRRAASVDWAAAAANGKAEIIHGDQGGEFRHVAWAFTPTRV